MCLCKVSTIDVVSTADLNNLNPRNFQEDFHMKLTSKAVLENQVSLFEFDRTWQVCDARI